MENEDTKFEKNKQTLEWFENIQWIKTQLKTNHKVIVIKPIPESKY